MSGLFAVNKPSGISSAGLLNDLQHIFKKSPLFESEIRAQQLRGNAGRHKLKMQNKIKMGHGGTLDPLASGVLVVGTGQGTKLLSQFLSCSKDYEAVALFGCSTDTYDSEGKIVHKKPWKHITRELLESTIGQFRGDIRQIPPIYSALKMEGKPLYEYAREGKPLPRAIEARSANVSRFEITKFTTDHGWTFPKEMASEETILSADLLDGIRPQANLTSLPAEQPITSNAEGPSEEAGRPTKRVKTDEDTSNDKEQDRTSDASHEHPLAVHIKMTVSSGTYVRSLIHDLGLALGSAAHMVALVRNRVGDFTLEDAIAWEAFQTNSWQDAICKKLKLEQQGKPDDQKVSLSGNSK